MKGRRVRIASVAVVLVALAAAYGGHVARAWERGLAPVAAPSPPAGDAAAITRGAKLAAIGNCITCHTATQGQPLAGGLPLQTPFGVIYSTNITPDKDTGIGDWSLDAFTRAMRRGVSRDGHLLYPAFPYPHFAQMSDADIAALYAWLMSRASVNAPAPHNALMFPLGLRPLMAVWNQLYLPPASAASTASATSTDAQAQQVARGRYLVESLGHCGACHTPLNHLGAERRDHALQGGTLEGWDAPALTDLTARPRPWTQAQLTNYLRTGYASEHGAAAGPMRTVTRSLADDAPEDIDAIAAYLMTLQSNPNAAAPPAAASVHVSTAPANGATLFAAACASCHAEGAAMSTDGYRPSLSLSTAVNADSPRNMVRILLDGIAWHESEAGSFMPPFAGTFTDTQIAELANYTRARFSALAPWSALDAQAVARLRKESPSR
ncbi:cytochrome c [Paraburkholderia sp. EG287B]|uniref:cytochrome c n=1 Tax=Paraburkholderia sp. EG287B TaxID=3237010 RepID=UPI0034D1E862